MSRLFYPLLELAARVLTSPGFWIVLLCLILLSIAVSLYRRLKMRTIERIQYSRTFSTDGVFVGEALELTETLSNPTWFPLFSVKMEFFMPSGLTIDGVVCNEYTKLTSVFTVPPFSKVRKRHTVQVDRRDHYKFFTAQIQYRGVEYTYDSAIDFYAYPNRFDADPGFSPDVLQAGEAIASRKYIEDPFFFSGLREYRPGDAVRSINHKASCRAVFGGMRRLMCNEYDSSQNYDSMIFLDLTASSEAELDTVEQVELGLRYACYLFGLGINHGGSIGFCANCAVDTARYIHIPCGSGTSHTKLILEQFAEISPYAKRDYSMTRLLQKHAPELSRGTDVYWITPFVDDKTAQALSELRRTGLRVAVIPLSRRV